MSATKTRRTRLSVNRLDDRITPSATRVAAYYTEWSTYDRNYQVSDIPADKVTDLIYSFAAIQNNQVSIVDSWASLQKPQSYNGKSYSGNLAALQALKADHPQMKTFIAVGGWTLSDPFPTMAADAASRKTFVDSAVKFIRDYKMDGVDIDWEYPVSGGFHPSVAKAADKHNFTLLIQDLRAGLDLASAQDSKTYLLTAAMGAGAGIIPNNYEINDVAKSLDWIDVMSYDYHGSGWEKQTNNQAQLTPDPADHSDGNAVNNQTWSVQQFLNAGVPADKLQLGVPLYGRTWQNVPAGPNNDGLYQTSTGTPNPADVWQDTVVGPGTWERGVFDYKDLYNRLKTQPTVYHQSWDAAAQVPYVYATGALDTAIKNPQTGERDNTIMPKVFSTYENPQSLAAKLAYAQQQHLGGVFFWELSGDLPVSNPDSLVRRTTEILQMPSVQAVQVNDGSAQRSMVRSMTVTFNTQVTFTGSTASAFTLTRIGGGAVSFTATAAVVNGQTVVTLGSFTGSATENGSLADGRFNMTVLSNKVQSAFGFLDGNGDGTAGDDYVLAGNTTNKLFRLYGDANGDGVVNAADLGLFRNAYGSSTGQAGVDYLDFNGDGVINASDLGRFRNAYGSSVS